MDDTKDIKKISLHSMRAWLANDMDIRVTKGALVLGAALVAILLIVAID